MKKLTKVNEQREMGIKKKKLRQSESNEQSARNDGEKK